jgi:hypothetical protein
VAAAYAVKKYEKEAPDEISFEVRNKRFLIYYFGPFPFRVRASGLVDSWGKPRRSA